MYRVSVSIHLGITTIFLIQKKNRRPHEQYTSVPYLKRANGR